MSLTLEDLVSEVKAIYKPLLGKSFEGEVQERDTSAVCTGGPRDIVAVHDYEVLQIMKDITNQIEVLSDKIEPQNGKEKVWKGITVRSYEGIIEGELWVESYKGDNGDNFTVSDYEVVKGLNWQKSYVAMVNKKSYVAMVNIILN